MVLRKTKFSFEISLIVLFCFFAGSFLVFNLVASNDVLSGWIYSYGYIIAIPLGIAAGFKFIIPVPPVAFIPIFLSAKLSAFPVAILLAIGMTIAYSIEYKAALSGLDTLSNPKLLRITNRLHLWKQKHFILPLIFLFLYTALIPAPNEFSLPIFTGLGYKLGTITSIMLLGNIIFMVLYGIGITKVFTLI